MINQNEQMEDNDGVASDQAEKRSADDELHDGVEDFFVFHP